MKFAKYTFLIAGIYGLVVLVPQYFLEHKLGADSPPAITHAEFFYGFIGVGIAFQLVFLIISRDPPRYRLLILPSIVEKFSFGIAVAALFATGRVQPQMFAAGLVDTLLGAMFVVSWFKLRG